MPRAYLKRMDILEQKRNDTYSIQFSIKEGGKVVGWAFLVIIQNDRHDEPYALLENVYVEHEYRGKGLGTRLINRILERSKELGCYKIITQSRYGKDDVHALYTKFGFRDHGKNFRMDLVDSKVKQRD